MDTHEIRWHNAKLLHILFGDAKYSVLARHLGKDVALVQKWFNRDKFSKAIGTDAARDLEQLLKNYITIETGTKPRRGWMDTPHYDLWAKYLNVEAADGIDAQYYPVRSIYSAVAHILKRIQDNDLDIPPDDIAAMVVRYLPLWSPDEDTRTMATDSIIVETAKAMAAKIKKK